MKNYLNLLKIAIIISLSFVFSSEVYSQFFEKDRSYIGIAYGFPNVFDEQLTVIELLTDTESTTIGPLSLNYELGIHEFVGIFIQAGVAKSNIAIDLDPYGSGGKEDFSLFYYGLQARIVGHYPKINKIDPYVAIGMGYHHIKFDFIGITLPVTSPALIIGAIGVKFHFETNVSAYFEFSSGITPLTIGASLKL